jgi:hypothetical protein
MLAVFLMLIAWYKGNVYGDIPLHEGRLTRLTVSKNDTVMYPSMDAAGKTVVYRQETLDPKGQKIVSIRLVRIEDLSKKILFVDGSVNAPPPHEGRALVCGTKPPVISGDGSTVAFTLTLGSPDFVDDHYLAVIKTDGTGLQILPVKNQTLVGKDLDRWDFEDDSWRTISQYRISNDGRHVACLVKGHMGAREISMPSGILIVASDGTATKTLLTPELQRKGWHWVDSPSRPFTGGGWIFDFSGNGKKVLFGARSSKVEESYDVYTMDADGGGIERLTNIEDRWFVRGDISDDGTIVCLYYSGGKLNGTGTYVAGFGSDDLRRLRSEITDRVDFEEMTGDGTRIFYRILGAGLAVQKADGSEYLILDERRMAPQGLKNPLDYPYFPSFWNPSFVSVDGGRMILEGVPTGKDRREFFLFQHTLP